MCLEFYVGLRFCTLYTYLSKCWLLLNLNDFQKMLRDLVIKMLKIENDDPPSIPVVNKLCEYLFQEEIGKGAHGTVFRVVRKQDGKIMAIKKMNLVKLKSKVNRDFTKEATLLMSLDHPNVIKCFDAFVNNGFLYIVMEYAEVGDLHVVG